MPTGCPVACGHLGRMLAHDPDQAAGSPTCLSRSPARAPGPPIPEALWLGDAGLY